MGNLSLLLAWSIWSTICVVVGVIVLVVALVLKKRSQ